MILNAIYTLGMQIFAYRCLRNPAFFIKVTTETVEEGKKQNWGECWACLEMPKENGLYIVYKTPDLVLDQLKYFWLNKRVHVTF